jgi:ATP-dependent DNA helicase RecG
VDLAALQALVAEGESERLEFKKSTGDLKGGLETLCAFLNGDGGRVLFGVSAAGAIRGQEVSDSTLREVGNELLRLEPPAHIIMTRVPVDGSCAVLVLETTVRSGAPYCYNGRAFRRVGTNTSLMPQKDYQRRLLERDHAQQRWEN